MVMRESEHKYREVFESLGEAAFLADEATGKVIDTNRCAEKMLGCTRGEILGKKYSQFLIFQDSRKEPNGAPFDCTLANSSGRPVPVRVHASKLTLHGRALVLWLCAEAVR
jgi:PAS domain S-box-containing protein